jgi:TetR/AcrR family transcriptional regulator, regulator of autoinduction and epiphytic fitness
MQVTKLDGRRARGARTRDAIVSALLDLVGSGTTAPTAQMIADRAGVSVRSVYQHFNDVEGLYADAAVRMHQSVVALRREVDPSLPRQTRIDEYVSQRAAILEAVTPFSRAAQLIEPASEMVRANRETLQRESRDRLSHVFAVEIDSCDDTRKALLLDALDVVTSWSAWEYLRLHGNSVQSAQKIMKSTIDALLSSTHT